MCAGKGGEGTIVQSSYKRPQIGWHCSLLWQYYVFHHLLNTFFAPAAFQSVIRNHLISFPSALPLSDKSGWQVFGYCPDYINTLFSSCRHYPIIIFIEISSWYQMSGKLSPAIFAVSRCSSNFSTYPCIVHITSSVGSSLRNKTPFSPQPFVFHFNSAQCHSDTTVAFEFDIW